MYTLIIIKNFFNYIKKSFFILQIQKKNFCLLNIRIINLPFDELKLIVQYRNISDYENKSKEDLIKAPSKPKSKLGINKNKLKEIKKGFLQFKTEVF